MASPPAGRACCCACSCCSGNMLANPATPHLHSNCVLPPLPCCTLDYTRNLPIAPPLQLATTLLASDGEVLEAPAAQLPPAGLPTGSNTTWLGCIVADNALMAGSIVDTLDGLPSAEDCCRACRNNTGCNLYKCAGACCHVVPAWSTPCSAPLCSAPPQESSAWRGPAQWKDAMPCHAVLCCAVLWSAASLLSTSSCISLAMQLLRP